MFLSELPLADTDGLFSGVKRRYSRVVRATSSNGVSSPLNS